MPGLRGGWGDAEADEAGGAAGHGGAEAGGAPFITGWWGGQAARWGDRDFHGGVPGV